jgi:hypothetical protein
LVPRAWSAVAATSGVLRWPRPRGISAPCVTVPRPAAVAARTARGCGGRATRMGVRRWALTGRMPGEA